MSEDKSQVLCRGIRGATTASSNSREDILQSTRELLTRMVEANQIDIAMVAGITFTTTSDLNAEFPAIAGRELGWTETAMLCGHEMNVPGSLPRCIRVMMLINTSRKPHEIVHVYLREATSLRPDKVPGSSRAGGNI